MIEFKPASRQGVKPLIAITGESNSGKTFSALLLARGIAGPTGKICLGDTESGRGALYAEQIPGGYLRCDMEPPFSPQSYCDVLDVAEKADAAVVVFDSFSHEWEGEGGVLDMAAEIEASSGKAGLHCWKKPKSEHKLLTLRLQRSKAVVIVCLRAMHKTRQVVGPTGKKEIVKDQFLTPIQSDGFVFDATIILDMQRGQPGHFVLSKWSVPELKDCFPSCGPEALSPGQVSTEHGAAIARWCSGAALPKSPPDQKAISALKGKIWKIAKGPFKEQLPVFEFWLQSEMLMSSTQKLADLDADALTGIYQETFDRLAVMGNAVDTIHDVTVEAMKAVK